MYSHFPLYSSPHALCRKLWSDLLVQGDAVIDATMGSGKDTAALACILQERGGGTLYSMDIQQLALSKTKALLSTIPVQQVSIHLLQACHTNFPQGIQSLSIKLIVYNLGYLPGSGNKQLTTLSSTTLTSISLALSLLCNGGAISIMAYPGHSEGATENTAIIGMLKTLSKEHYLCSQHSFLNRSLCPIVYIIQKRIS